MPKILTKEEQTKLNNQLFEAIKLGKDLNDIAVFLEQIPEIDVKDELGRTPLHWAVLCNNLPLVKLLLEKQAKIDLQDKEGCTALYHAVMWGHKEIVDLLLQNGADPNIANNKKETPLHSLLDFNIRDAIEIEPIDELAIAKLLVEKGTDLNKLDIKGKSPLFYATWDIGFGGEKSESFYESLRNNRTKIVNLFINNGAKITKPLFDEISSKTHNTHLDITDILKSAVIDKKYENYTVPATGETNTEGVD